MEGVLVSLEELRELQALVEECDHVSYCDLSREALAGEPSPAGPCACGRDELSQRLTELGKRAL